MENNFKVGGLVICINDLFPGSLNFFKPTKGQIYTIRKVIKFENGEDGILLEEIVNGKIKFKNGMHEPCFAISRFKPIDEVYKPLGYVVNFKIEETKLTELIDYVFDGK
jgi:hypothetical protein